jgi:hypothetical protein
MESNENIENANSTNGEAEGGDETDVVKLAKADYDKLNQTLGSLKRELKDLKKPKEEPVETAKETKTNQPDNSLLQKLERMALRQAGITHTDDIELAQRTAKKWGVDIDEVLSDEDFKVKLEHQQSGRANVEATSNVRGGVGTSGAKNTPEYWLAKGVPPTATDIPDVKTRRKINVAFYKSGKQESVKFYNS